jgi:hypothetical protein
MARSFANTQAFCTATCLRTAFRYHVSPPNEQRRLLDQPVAACRWLAHRRLEERTTAWEQRQEAVRLSD